MLQRNHHVHEEESPPGPVPVPVPVQVPVQVQYTTNTTTSSSSFSLPHHSFTPTPPPRPRFRPLADEAFRTPLESSRSREANHSSLWNSPPIPSPLHSSSSAGHSSTSTSTTTTPTTTTVVSPCASPPTTHSARSPREKLDDLLLALADDHDHHTASPSSPSPSPKNNNPLQQLALHPISPSLPALRASQPTTPHHISRLVSHVRPRNVSAPIPPTAAAISPLAATTTTMPPPSRPSRPETRPTPPPRNPSIDSASSSLSSSTSQPLRNHVNAPQRAFSDPNSSSSAADMAALIAAAGSPEAAFLNLLKEKNSATNHNSQLWRLVEKQRAMIIGLQRDLERALKDKDRYRKKLKEYTAQVPPVPGAPKRSDTFDSVVERDDSQSPAPSDVQEDTAKPLVASVARSAEHKTSPLTQGTSAAQFLTESQVAQSPTSDSLTASNPTSSLNSPTDLSVKPLALHSKGLGLTAPTDDASSTEAQKLTESPKAVAPQPFTPPEDPRPSTDSLKAPALSLTQATPVLGGDGFEPPPQKLGQPSRKAPPAPLNLVKPGKPSAHLHQAETGDHDDSDYDDVLEVDEIPIVDRGRRKTREEDDRVREAMAMAMEAESARSKSKKKKGGSKPTSATSATSGEADAQHDTHLSPQLSPHQTGLPLSPRHPPANSLNALLSPANSDSSTMAQRSLASPPPLMSPGLPNSPRPGDRPIGSPLPRHPKQSLASPPMSPRSNVNGISSQASQPPRQQVPLPPNTPQSYTSPQSNRPEPSAQQKQQQQQQTQPSASDLLRPANAQSTLETENAALNGDVEHVYRGLVSDQYPGLLLPPNALPSIEVKVSSSRLRPSRLSFLAPKPQEEDPVFHLAIYARSDRKQLWRMEKTIMALPALDQQLKSLCNFQGKLPDRALFSGHAPAKIDARRVALNNYFDTILETPMDEKAALVVCEFFSTDVIGAQNGDALAPEPAAPQAAPTPKGKQQKEGYLTKRGKNFGGWKARYFVLEGAEFRYYEMAGGAHLGTIKLQNAQIGKQSQQQSNQSPQRRDDSEDNQYRHAFLILEPKRKDSASLVRHVLCAESDEERDAWVDALLQHVDYHEEASPTESHSQHAAGRPAVLTKTQTKEAARPKKRDSPDAERQHRLQGLSYDDTVAAEAPIRGPSHREAKEAHLHSPKHSSISSDSSRQHPSISGPSNGAPIQDAGSWGNKSLAAPTSVKDKKRSIFGFGSRGRVPESAPEQMHQQQYNTERVIQQNRNVFGIPLAEAVEYTQPIGLRDPLPAVVFRCLEYLRAKKAINEEGIFRLSGSNIVIRGLRERFNTEGDVKLLHPDGQYYDIHAVASLLKLYLRELPSSILTRDLHLDFLKVLDMDERSKKIQTFNVLVHKLPPANFELIRHMSSFLIEIVENAGVNKMTVRNVGIVFAPTLNIPAPLISFFLTDYPDIFGTPIDEATSPIHELRTTTPQLGDEIRSPRRQMFSDLPTPAYNETSFQQPPHQQYDRPPSSFPSGFPPQHPPPPPPQQQQQYNPYAGYDTGLAPIRPSYEAPAYEQHYQQAEGYGSLKSSAPSGNAKEQRQRRRESGMLLMTMGQQRKGSNGSNPPRLRDEHRTNPMLIREETAFD
ncbi:hypothetical protein DM02DRAFT_627764 [Periconia macrospinosa]|uniref:RhoGAP-domain-containing protein n=1 Tax=Periconia macrospinosa TaxID=97972 RepID=A0A2V1DT60_9PLEO|nr:hypothetical protein DM02DRAFT_627764 [Periconia macrospinosa]